MNFSGCYGSIKIGRSGILLGLPQRKSEEARKNAGNAKIAKIAKIAKVAKMQDIEIE